MVHKNSFRFSGYKTLVLSNALFVILCCLFLSFQAQGQVVEVLPVFPKVTDDVTIYFNATEGNGALTGISPVYAHTGLITSESQNGSDWKFTQGVWGTADAHVLMQSLGNNRHSISYNIKDFYGLTGTEDVHSLSFVFRNANGSVVGRSGDGSDIFYPVYPANVDFISQLLTPQQASLALFANEVLPIRGASSQDAKLSILDNEDTLSTAFGQLIDYNLTITEPGNHTVKFVAVRGTDTLTHSFFYTVIVNVEVADPPAGREDGITMIDDSTVYFQLYAPGKSFVHLVGDMSDWNLRGDFQMKKSTNGNTWWLEITGLDPGSRYSYQYVVDGTIRIGDPYSTLILDPFNDNYISSETYPNMPQYPYDKTSGMVSNFTLEPTTTIPPLNPKPAKTDLIVYELLVRDFVGAHSFKVVQDTLDYLQRLGVNAIELMPVNEFEGNIGWGYNPSYHMALDKYYGPAEDLKALIEECHSRGMAVILDVVYNHAFGQSPLALLYWDGPQNRPAADNPWLNPVAKHNLNVGNDFNHESPATRYFVKRVLRWWMQTYGVDGFRFDLSKGFTQHNTLGDNNAWIAYDSSRINILQDYADQIWSIDPDAYVILEHFADNSEEKELSSRGMMIWGNMRIPFTQGSTGFGGSDFSNTWYIQRGWSDPNLVGYMESHDEERIMYKNLTVGNTAPGYNIKDLEVGLSRIELVSTFLFLIPGPKMIWEFGELGYDYPINYCEDGSINTNCRLSPKPIRWDYKDVLLRQRIYDIDRAVIALRKQTAFKEGNLEISLVSQFEKKMRFRHPDMDIVVVGNFHIGNRDIAPVFTKAGWWYDYLKGDSLLVNDVNMLIPYKPGEYHIYTTKRIKLDFDITTSIAEIDFSAMPLMIYPTLNQGQFEIGLPDQTSEKPEIKVTDMSGRSVEIRTDFNAENLSVELVHPIPGLYVISLIQGHTLYTGKMFVQ